MKKFFCCLLAFIMTVSMLPCAGAVDVFDYEDVLGSLNGYEYDAQNQKWFYYKAYVYTYADALVIIGLESYGEAGGSNPERTELYCRIQNSAGEKVSSVSSFELRVGNNLYSYSDMDIGSWSSSVPIGENGLRLLTAIRDCNPADVAIRLGTQDGNNYDINIDTGKFTNTLQEFSKVYLDNNMNSYMVGDMAGQERMYPLIISSAAS